MGRKKNTIIKYKRWKRLKNKITFETTTRHFLVANAFQILINFPIKQREKKNMCTYFKFIFIAIAIEVSLCSFFFLPFSAGRILHTLLFSVFFFFLFSCFATIIRFVIPQNLTPFANCTHDAPEEKKSKIKNGIQFEMIVPAIFAPYETMIAVQNMCRSDVNAWAPLQWEK